MPLTTQRLKKPAAVPTESNEPKTISGEVPGETYAKVATEAKRQERTVAGQLRVILNDWAANQA